MLRQVKLTSMCHVLSAILGALSVLLLPLCAVLPASVVEHADRTEGEPVEEIEECLPGPDQRRWRRQEASNSVVPRDMRSTGRSAERQNLRRGCATASSASRAQHNPLFRC